MAQNTQRNPVLERATWLAERCEMLEAEGFTHADITNALLCLAMSLSLSLNTAGPLETARVLGALATKAASEAETARH